MKIVETLPRELYAYTYDITGIGKIYFKKAELPDIFLKIDEYIKSVKKRFPNLEWVFDFRWNWTSACVYWSRYPTTEEKIKIKEMKKKENEEIKNLERKQAIKLAKKYKLIK